MIITKLYGGLGNQLFQFWSSFVYATKIRTQLCFDIRAFDRGNPGSTKREFEIIELIKLFSSYKINSSFDNCKYDFLFRLGRIKVLNDKQHGLLINQEKSRNLILDGYWQNYRNLIDDREYIRKIMFNLKKYSLNQYELSSENSLMIHVRRGDYVSNPKANRHHGVLSREYFLDAFETINSQRKIDHILVFSDDINWCKQNLDFNLKTSFIHDLDELRPIDYLLLMSEAKYFVLSHSSFSWWAAFLGESDNSTVIMPDVWDKVSGININRLALPKWKTLEAKIN